jgi:hypothetical protein
MQSLSGVSLRIFSLPIFVFQLRRSHLCSYRLNQYSILRSEHHIEFFQPILPTKSGPWYFLGHSLDDNRALVIKERFTGSVCEIQDKKNVWTDTSALVSFSPFVDDCKSARILKTRSLITVSFVDIPLLER